MKFITIVSAKHDQFVLQNVCPPPPHDVYLSCLKRKCVMLCLQDTYEKVSYDVVGDSPSQRYFQVNSAGQVTLITSLASVQQDYFVVSGPLPAVVVCLLFFACEQYVFFLTSVS